MNLIDWANSMLKNREPKIFYNAFTVKECEDYNEKFYECSRKLFEKAAVCLTGKYETSVNIYEITDHEMNCRVFVIELSAQENLNDDNLTFIYEDGNKEYTYKELLNIIGEK
jgi:hypothetical protein